MSLLKKAESLEQDILKNLNNKKLDEDVRDLMKTTARLLISIKGNIRRCDEIIKERYKP